MEEARRRQLEAVNSKAAKAQAELASAVEEARRGHDEAQQAAKRAEELSAELTAAKALVASLEAKVGGGARPIPRTPTSLSLSLSLVPTSMGAVLVQFVRR